MNETDPRAANTARRDAAPRAPRAVLWDLDGTLVESGPLWRAAYDDLARRLGGALPSAAWRRMTGTTIRQSVVVLREELGVHDPTPTAELAGWLVDRAVTRLSAGTVPAWRLGAHEALQSVQHEGVPTALVTTTWRRLVDQLLDVLDVSFDVVVCGDEVAHGKPDPEPYLRAARLLGVQPAHCVAVEDSPTGIAAAEAAGIPVLAVTSPAPGPAAPGRAVRDSLVGLTLGELARVGSPPDPDGGAVAAG